MRQQISLLMAALLCLGCCTQALAQQSPVIDRVDLPADRKLREALARPCEMTFTGKPLTEIAAMIHAEYQIPVVIDAKRFEEANVKPNIALTMHAHQTSLRAALTYLLKPVDLFFVMEGGVLLITTADRAEQSLDSRVYGISELATVPGSRAPDYDTLVDVIENTIKPTSWDAVGGPGDIQVLPSAGCIIVSQTDEVHEEIEQLLVKLHAARERMLAMKEDVRHLEVATAGQTIPTSAPEPMPIRDVAGPPHRTPLNPTAYIVDVQRPQPRRGK